MKKTFLKFYLILSVILAQGLSAEGIFTPKHSDKDSLSNGTLIINNTKKIPVRIFATTWGPTFAKFANVKLKKSTLVILNHDIKETLGMEQQQYGSMVTWSDYQKNGFIGLTKKFRLTSNFNDTRYLYKPINQDQQLSENDHIKLSTSFMIWDPPLGIPIGSFTLHFYSLMFVFAFGLGYLIMQKIYKIDGVDTKLVEPLFTWTLIGTILGARLGHVIFYQPELFKQDFWSVFLPIQTKPHFAFTGFSGLASHGAAIALIFTTLYYSFKIIKKNPFWVYDRIGIVVALGGMFVRFGNFFNSEILGRSVNPNSPLAILFPQQSQDYGLTIPRLPSQLFEGFGYFLLFLLLWFLYRKTKKKYQQGWLFGLFFIILWSIRFIVEFFKEPQGDEVIHWGGLDTGQVLSIPFIIAGIVIMIYSKKMKIKE